MKLKKGLLIFSFFTVSIIALLYGVSPRWFFGEFLVNSQAPSIDQSHILRAVMMLYIALGLFWLYSVFRTNTETQELLYFVCFAEGLSQGEF